MATTAARAPRLQSKGALRPDALYVERLADTTLREALLAGEFCYVLAPRQIGKSSLRFHVARQLERERVRCVHLDLNAMGLAEGEGGREGWYFALTQKLSDDLALPDPGPFFHTERSQLPPVQRWRRYLREVVLATQAQRVVVFVDEIDYVRKLGFDSDEFFAAVRAIYNDRAEDTELGRLTFCLLGVAAPSELIKDGKITPFNIGQSIHLTDFSRPEIDAFSATLAPLGGATPDWLDELFAWTSGHPYMTHALCEQLLQSVRASPLPEVTRERIKERVETVVRKGFLLLGRAEDPSLSYAETRLDGHPRRADLLALYRKLLLGQTEPVRGDDPVQQELRLCGLCRVDAESQELRVRNRIFARVFNYDWVHDQEVAHLWSEAFQKWRSGGKRRDSLLRATQLELAQEWAHEHANEVSVEENEFLLASVEEARRQTAAQAEAERARLLRRVIVGLASALGIFVVLTVAVYGQYWEARRQEQAARLAQQRERDTAQRERDTAQRERLAKEEAESRMRTEQSLRAAALVQQQGSPYAGLVAGMNAAAPELLSGHIQPASWEGLTLATHQATLSTPLNGHSNELNAAVYSPDGRQLATASDDRTVILWSVASGKPEAKLEGHRGGIFTAVYSPDSSRILTTSYDGTAWLWDARSGRQLRMLENSPLGLFAAAYSPDGKQLVTGAEDGRARIWDAVTGRLLHTLTGHRLRVCAAAYSPDGKYLITGSYDATARIWSAQSGQQVAAPLIHSTRVFAVAYAPDGQRVATGSYDQLARIWDVASGKLLRPLEGHRSHVLSVDYSPDGQQLLSGSYDGTARIWDVVSGRTVRVLEGHSQGVSAARYAPGGKQLVTSSYDGTARIWDLTQGKRAQALAGHRNWILAVSRSPAAPKDKGESGGASSGQLLTGSYDGTARIWDLATGQTVRTLVGHRGGIRAAAYLPGGAELVTSSYDGTIRFWDARSGQQLRQLDEYSELVRAVAFSPDGRSLATGTEDGLARIHDQASGKTRLRLEGHSGEVLAVAFSPDGRRLATGSADGTARLWDTQSGSPLPVVLSPGSALRTVAWSPDGKLVAAGSANGTARIWDSERGTLLRLLEGHRGKLEAVGFSPDGTLLVTGADDGTVRLWQVAGSLNDKSTLVVTTQAASLQSAELVVLPGGLAGGMTLRTVSTDSAFRALLEEFPLGAAELYRYGCQVLRGFDPAKLPNTSEASVRQALAACPR